MSTDLVRTNTGRTDTGRTDVAPASVVATTARPDTGPVRSGGEVEVLPRPVAAARPGPGRPGRPSAGTRTHAPTTQAPTTRAFGVTFAVLPATTTPPALTTGAGDVAAPPPAPPAPARVVIGPPPVLPPGRTPPGWSAGDLVPRPAGDLTSRPGGDLVPRPGGDLAPRSGGGLVPRAASDLMLRPASDRTLRPGGDLVPRLAGGLAADRGGSGGPSLPGRMLELARAGRTRARGLTAQDKRVLAYLALALVVALGGQTDPAAPAPSTAAASAALPAGAQVAATAQVLALADAQVGTVEARDGSTPYHRDYGLAPNQPWCAVFVWDLFRDAGGADSIHPKTAFTPTLADWFRDRGQWSATPAVGALVFYDWPGDRLNRIQHVGIVESFTATTITTIEGNTSNSTNGSQDDGDGVWRRTRPRDGAVVGYGLPIYRLAP